MRNIFKIGYFSLSTLAGCTFFLPHSVLGDSTSTVNLAAPAVEKPKGSVTVKVYAEWFYDIADKVDKESGFDLTRCYFGYKHDFSDKISGNVNLDVGRSNEVTGVTSVYDTLTRKVATTLATDTRYKAFLKTAALKFQDILPRTTLEAGMVGTNQFSVQEKFWGYRYVYKTFVDQNGYGEPADLGTKVSVKLTDYLGLNAELLNGEGFKKPQDANGYYKMSGSLDLKLPMGITAAAYYDNLPMRKLETQSNILAFVGYEMKDLFRVGGEYDMQIANKGIVDHDLNGLSAFAAYIVNKQLEVFARFDMLQSASDWNKATDGQTLIAGFQCAPVKGVKVAADYQGFTSAVSGVDPQPKFKLNLEYSL